MRRPPEDDGDVMPACGSIHQKPPGQRIRHLLVAGDLCLVHSAKPVFPGESMHGQHHSKKTLVHIVFQVDLGRQPGTLFLLQRRKSGAGDGANHFSARI